MTPASPPPLVGLVAALVVLIGGVAAALSSDDSNAARTGPTITSSTVPPSSSTSTTTTSTQSTLPATSLPPTSIPAPPAVPSPERAANGLWAAYSSGNRAAASRFATQEVIDFLFETPDTGEEGSFESCRRQAEGLFVCDYRQPSAHFTMTVRADDNKSYKVVNMAIERAVTTTTDS